MGNFAKHLFTDAVQAFIASHSDNGWPCGHRRGGPVGSFKVTGPQQIEFADYTGNKQVIIKGNHQTDARANSDIILRSKMAELNQKLETLANRLTKPGEDPAALISAQEVHND